MNDVQHLCDHQWQHFCLPTHMQLTETTHKTTLKNTLKILTKKHSKQSQNGHQHTLKHPTAYICQQCDNMPVQVSHISLSWVSSFRGPPSIKSGVSILQVKKSLVSPGTSIAFHLFLKDKRKLHKKFLFLKTMQYNITIKLVVNTHSLQQMEINICLSFKCRNKKQISYLVR